MMRRYTDRKLLIRFGCLWWLIQLLRLVINPNAHHDRLGIHHTLYIVRTFLNEPTTKYALTIQVNRWAALVETKPVITSDTDLLIVCVIKTRIVALDRMQLAPIASLAMTVSVLNRVPQARFRPCG